MTFIDTGFLVALAQPADALHQRALLWANSLLDTFILTEYVLCEVVNLRGLIGDFDLLHDTCQSGSRIRDSKLEIPAKDI